MVQSVDYFYLLSALAMIIVTVDVVNITALVASRSKGIL